MRTLNRSVMLLSVVVVLCVAAVASAQDRPRVAVLAFEDKAGQSWWYSQGAPAAQDVFVTALVKSGDFRVVERERLDALMAEKNLSLSGAVDTSTAIQAGKLLGVKYFVTGAMTSWEFAQSGGSASRLGGLSGIGFGRNKFSTSFDARLIDTETGEIVWADDCQAKTSKFKGSVEGFSGGEGYSQNTISTLVKPCIEELAGSLSKKF